MHLTKDGPSIGMSVFIVWGFQILETKFTCGPHCGHRLLRKQISGPWWFLQLKCSLRAHGGRGNMVASSNTLQMNLGALGVLGAPKQPVAEALGPIMLHFWSERDRCGMLRFFGQCCLMPNSVRGRRGMVPHACCFDASFWERRWVVLRSVSPFCQETCRMS